MKFNSFSGKYRISVLLLFPLLVACVPAPDDQQSDNNSEFTLQVDQDSALVLKGDGLDPFLRATQRLEGNQYRSSISMSWNIFQPTGDYLNKLVLNFAGSDIKTYFQDTAADDTIFVTLIADGNDWASDYCIDKSNIPRPQIEINISEYETPGGRVKGTYEAFLCSATPSLEDRLIKGTFDVPNMGEVD